MFRISMFRISIFGTSAKPHQVHSKAKTNFLQDKAVADFTPPHRGLQGTELCGSEAHAAK